MSAITAVSAGDHLSSFARAERPITAFLIPGVFGDEPQIKDLRRCLQGTFRFDLLSLPDVGARRALLTDMAAAGWALVGEIMRRQPTGPVSLVGYSFGASMVLEVAVQLTDAGRNVAFLGVLDGPFEPPKFPQRQETDRVLEALRKMLKTVVVEAMEALGPMRRLVARAAPPETSADHRAEAMRRAVLWHLRNKALMGWTPRGCSAPGIHVSTGDYGFDNWARWSKLCPNLVHFEVPAVHQDMLKGKSLKTVTSFLRASARARCL